MNRSLFQAAGIWIPTALALLFAGCARDMPLTRREASGFILYAADDDSAAEARRAGSSLASIAGRLKVPVPVSDLAVYILPSRASLKRYLKEHCPKQASKAAACFTVPAGYVIALAPERFGGDVTSLLRHEITHYLLASRYFDFPPWIDEGLAQYFEEEDPGSAPESGDVGRMRRDAAGISAGGIEEILAVPPGDELTGKQYREAKVLLHFLMEDSAHGPEQVTCYLRQVRSDGGHLDYLQRCFRLSPAELADGARSRFSRPR